MTARDDGGGGARHVAVGIGATIALLVLVVGVPGVLVRTVGNPWPGTDRLRLADEAALVSGVLAAVAWLVWARFVAAVGTELVLQVRAVARRDGGDVPAAAPLHVAPPPPVRGGVGAFAHHLVAAALVLVVFFSRPAPAAASSTGPPPLGTARPIVSELVADAPATASSRPVAATRDEPAAGPRAATSVIVEPGDTLIGLAREHLGDGARWREIFERNRDRPQVDGGRLTTPSLIRIGWSLELPAGAPVADTTAARPDRQAASTTVIVEPGDTVWDLSHDRLAAAGLAHDDGSVAAYVEDVVAANPGLADPDVVMPGEAITLPAVDGVPAPQRRIASSDRPAPERPPREQSRAPRPQEDERAGRERPAAARPPTRDGRGAPAPAPAASSSTTVVTTSTTTAPAVPRSGADGTVAERDQGSPGPIGAGEAALLSAGVVALLVARRRHRLRAARPRVRVPEPAPEQIATERALRAVDAAERIMRVDVCVRAAAATLVATDARISVIRASPQGTVQLLLTSAATLPAPWDGRDVRWSLAGTMPPELLAEPARTVGAPCVALTQLGVDSDGWDVFVDLEALGFLAVAAPPEQADAVVRGMAATLGTSPFSEVANLVGVGFDQVDVLDHPRAHLADDAEQAVELAVELVGSTATARQSTFVLRARHTSGEAWEPAVVLLAARAAACVGGEIVRRAAGARGGLAVVAAGDVPRAPWTLRAREGAWVLEPLGLALVPVGLSREEVVELHEVLCSADPPLIGDGEVASVVVDRRDGPRERLDAEEEPEGEDGEDGRDDEGGLRDVDQRDGVVPDPEPPWALLVRVLGPVEVVDRDGRAAAFERSRSLELLAWLALHRDHPTRTGARTALWDLDVRDATFANVVSDARRSLARHVPPPAGEEWLARTMTERLPLHPLVVTDADLVRARLAHARLQPPQLAIDTLRPAVALIRDLPFAGTGYLWPDPEGIASNLVLLATGAATELAAHHLALGDVAGVFWATGQGLKVLPGHEELIALRMRAHACAGDLSGVRSEWESYERALGADPWSDGEPARKLVLLRRELLAS